MRKTSLVFLLTIKLIILLLITSCTVQQGNEAGEPTLTNSIQQSGQETLTTSVTTEASTPTPTEISSFTPSPKATITVMSTLNSSDREKAVKSMLQNERGCKLPCFLEIFPGISKWDEVRTRFMDLGFQWSKPYNPYGTMSDPNEKIFYTSMGSAFSSYTLSISPLVNKEVIDGFGFQLGGSAASFTKYSIPNLILSEGTPSRIWMSSSSNANLDYRVFDLWVFYDQKGVAIKYQVSGSDKGGEIFVCPKEPNKFLKDPKSKLSSTNFYLQKMENTRKLENLIEIWGETVPNLPYPVDGTIGRSLNEATGLSPEDFYAIFAGSSAEECFTTPLALWIRK